MSDYPIIDFSGVTDSHPLGRTNKAEKSGSQQVGVAADGLSDQTGNMGDGSKAFLQNWMDRYSAWVKKLSD